MCFPDGGAFIAGGSIALLLKAPKKCLFVFVGDEKGLKYASHHNHKDLTSNTCCMKVALCTIDNWVIKLRVSTYVYLYALNSAKNLLMVV